MNSTATTTRLGWQLQAGDVVVRGAERIVCGRVDRSSAMPGYRTIDVEFGVLLVEDSDELTIESDTAGPTEAMLALRVLQERHAHELGQARDRLTSAEAAQQAAYEMCQDADQLRGLQGLHADALRSAEGDSNDDEIAAWRDLAETALGHVDGYVEPEVVHLQD